jgi:hypothetical protein
MKNVAILVFLTIVLSACKEISFVEPQPKGKKSLNEVPGRLRGVYLLKDEGSDDTDTLYVTKTGYLIASDKMQSVLGDSLVLKKYKGYYFVNINENPEWLLRVIRQEDNGDLTYMAMDVEDGAFDGFVKDLAREVGVDSVQLEDEKLYQIDPSPKQLIQLIKKGYFKKTIRMQKIE